MPQSFMPVQNGQIDYETEKAAILNQLRKATANQAAAATPDQTQFQDFGGITHAIVPSYYSPIVKSVRGAMGNFQETDAMNKTRNLNQQQMVEFNAIQEELAAIPTEKKRVLKQALAVEEQSAPQTANQQSMLPNATGARVVPPQPEYEEVGLTPEEMNARRMQVAAKMHRLPMAMSMGQELWKQGIDFPETQAALLEKEQTKRDAEQIRSEDRRFAAEQAAEARRQAQENANFFRQMQLQISQQNADTQAERNDILNKETDVKMQEKLNKLETAKADRRKRYETAAAEAENSINLIDKLIGKRDEKGQLLPNEKPYKGFNDYVGATVLPYASKIHGTDAAAYASAESHLKDKARLEGIEMMRGTGSISNAEGQAAANALNGASNAADEATYIMHMMEYRKYLNRAMDRAKRNIRVAPDAPLEGYKEIPAGSPEDVSSAEDRAIEEELNALRQTGGSPARQKYPVGTVIKYSDGTTVTVGEDGYAPE